MRAPKSSVPNSESKTELSHEAKSNFEGTARARAVESAVGVTGISNLTPRRVSMQSISLELGVKVLSGFCPLES